MLKSKQNLVEQIINLQLIKKNKWLLPTVKLGNRTWRIEADWNLIQNQNVNSLDWMNEKYKILKQIDLKKVS